MGISSSSRPMASLSFATTARTRSIRPAAFPSSSRTARSIISRCIREAKIIGRNTADPARWKRYKGGTAGHLWIDAEGSGQFRRMDELPGNVTSPMWVGDRVFFLSDFEGVSNLYSCRPDGSDRCRHTDHDAFYARHAQSDGARIVYLCGADIWLFDPATERAVPLDVQVLSHRTQAARRFVKAEDHLGTFRMHPAGHSLAVDVRGKMFSFALWEGAVRQWGERDGARYRLGQWLADGRDVCRRQRRLGRRAGPGLPRRCTARTRLGHWPGGRAAGCSQRSSVAISNHRNEVFVGDLDKGTLQPVDRSECGRTEDLAWSPDGAWLAYTFATSPRHTAIKLFELATGQRVLATQPEFRDYSPSFDPDGRYLYFLSLRTFDPVYDSVQFELSFPRAARPYLIALQAAARRHSTRHPRASPSGTKSRSL